VKFTSIKIGMNLWSKLNLKYLGIDFYFQEKAGFWAANKFGKSLSCATQYLILADVFSAQLQRTIEKQVLSEKVSKCKTTRKFVSF